MVTTIGKKTAMVHTAVLKSMNMKIDSIAKRTGLRKNIIVNTLLAEGLKQRSDLMAKTKKKAKKSYSTKK